MIDFLKNNWCFLIVIIIFLVFIGYNLYSFIKLPNNEKIKNVKEWLVYACAEAEKALGSQTGKLKLRMVYDMFVGKFPAIASWISFDTFSVWVDTALEEMEKLVTENKAVAEYIGTSKTTKED